MLIEQRLSYKEIQERLNLPPATFFRYLDLLFESDRDILLRYVDDKEILNQVVILQEKFIYRSKQLEDLIKDPKVRAADKISAHHLGAELDTAVFRLVRETPYELINRRQRLEYSQKELPLSLSSSSSLPSLPSSETNSTSSSSRVLSLRELKEQEERLR